MEKEKINGGHTYKCDNVEDEQDEEIKMDKFFALVRNIREARKVVLERKELKSIVINELEKDQKKKKKKKLISTGTTADERVQYSSWVPSFQLEDFTTHVDDQFIRRPPLILPNPSNKKLKQDHAGLDLNLTL